jgi:hypothetical protein
MYPDPYGPGPVDDMDPAARREFFGPGGRRGATVEPTLVPEVGNGYDKPIVPDPTTDHPLSTQGVRFRGDQPIGSALAAHGHADHLLEDPGYNADPKADNSGDAPPEKGRHKAR